MNELTPFEKYEIIKAKCEELKGVPYIWGGENPKLGVDCSGFIQIVLREINMDPPGDQTAQMLYNYFVSKAGTVEDVLGCGSLVFYGKSVKHITHVAIMIDTDRIYEAGGGGRECVSVDIARKKNACVRIRPFGHRKDEVAVLRPQY